MTREQRQVLEDIATAQSHAIQDFMARMGGEAYELPKPAPYARHACSLCGDTERLEDAPCPRCQP